MRTIDLGDRLGDYVQIHMELSNLLTELLAIIAGFGNLIQAGLGYADGVNGC